MAPDDRCRYYNVWTAGQDPGQDEPMLIMARNMDRAEDRVRAMGRIPVYCVEVL